MQRIHLLQNWFSLSDPAMEEVLYGITPMRQFGHLTLSAPIPEAIIGNARNSGYYVAAVYREKASGA